MSTSKRYEQFVPYWRYTDVMGRLGHKKAIGSKQSLKKRESVFIDLFVAGTHNVNMVWETRIINGKVLEGYFYVATPVNN